MPHLAGLGWDDRVGCGKSGLLVSDDPGIDE